MGELRDANVDQIEELIRMAKGFERFGATALSLACAIRAAQLIQIQTLQINHDRRKYLNQ